MKIVKSLAVAGIAVLALAGCSSNDLDGDGKIEDVLTSSLKHGYNIYVEQDSDHDKIKLNFCGSDYRATFASDGIEDDEGKFTVHDWFNSKISIFKNTHTITQKYHFHINEGIINKGSTYTMYDGPDGGKIDSGEVTKIELDTNCYRR